MYSREDVVKLLLNKRGVDPFSTGGVSIHYLHIQKKSKQNENKTIFYCGWFFLYEQAAYIYLKRTNIIIKSIWIKFIYICKTAGKYKSFSYIYTIDGIYIRCCYNLELQSLSLYNKYKKKTKKPIIRGGIGFDFFFVDEFLCALSSSECTRAGLSYQFLL